MTQLTSTHIDVHVTNACPLHCRHCGFASGQFGMSEMTLDEWIRVLHLAWDWGIREFHIMGGEPLYWPPLLELLQEMRRLGEPVIHLLTSGIGGQPAQAEEILALVDTVFLSFKGNQEFYRRHIAPNAFDEMKTFLNLANAACRLRLGMVVTRENLDHALEIPDMFLGWGIQPHTFCFMDYSPVSELFADNTPQPPALRCSFEILPAPQEWFEFARRAIRRYAAYPWMKITPAYSRNLAHTRCELEEKLRRIIVLCDRRVQTCFKLAHIPLANIFDADVLDNVANWIPGQTRNCCGGGCRGYAEIFEAECDPRCPSHSGGQYPERFRLPHALYAEGWRPICPCKAFPLEQIADEWNSNGKNFP